jgi:hypothetical protein
MGMQFTVTLTGDISAEVEAEDAGIDLDNANDFLDISSSVEVDDVSVSGTITVTASVRISDEEVEAADMADYDADAAISEHINSYGSVDVSNADFEVTDSPTGFDTVVEALGYDRDEAIKVYAALANAGLEVS